MCAGERGQLLDVMRTPHILRHRHQQRFEGLFDRLLHMKRGEVRLAAGEQSAGA